MIIDTHAHLGAPDFAEDLQEVVDRAHAAGVSRIISIGAGYGVGASAHAVALAERFPSVVASVGVHPCDTHEAHDRDELERLARHPKVVAIGETGLDLYRPTNPPLARQEEWFEWQIALAKATEHPLIIHCRAAAPQIVAQLTPHRGAVRGVFHCFTEDTPTARAVLDLGFSISVTGIITFKKADELRRTIATIPLDRLLVETDAPFLAPEPHRGKRCESAHTRLTTEALAALLGRSFEEVAAVTTANAESLFRLERALR